MQSDDQPQSITRISAELLETARSASSGRAARTLYGGQAHDLRQTLIALAEGRSLGEHDSPGEATLQVLDGSVRLSADTESWTADAGDHLIIPSSRHDLHAQADAVVLLTVATRAPRPD